MLDKCLLQFSIFLQQFSLTEKISMSPCEQFRYLLKQIQIGPKLLIYAKFNYKRTGSSCNEQP